MAKQTRRTWSDEDKQKLIEEHKPAYLSNKRAKINGKPATEELFNALPLNEQWDKIKSRLPKPEGTVKKAPSRYQEIRTRLNYVKKNIDFITDEQMQKVYEMFEEIKKADETRVERRKERETERLAKEIKEAEAKLQELKDLHKIIQED